MAESEPSDAKRGKFLIKRVRVWTDDGGVSEAGFFDGVSACVVSAKASEAERLPGCKAVLVSPFSGVVSGVGGKMLANPPAALMLEDGSLKGVAIGADLGSRLVRADMAGLKVC